MRPRKNRYFEMRCLRKVNTQTEWPTKITFSTSNWNLISSIFRFPYLVLGSQNWKDYNSNWCAQLIVTSPNKARNTPIWIVILPIFTSQMVWYWDLKIDKITFFKRKFLWVTAFSLAILIHYFHLFFPFLLVPNRST